MKKLFLDANIFFSAVWSSSGGSRALFDLARAGFIDLFSSQYVITEALRNVERKISFDAGAQVLNLVSELEDLVEASDEMMLQYESLIIKKDLPVLAAAAVAKVDALITLDKKDFYTETLNKADLPFKILTPRVFLQGF